ncbi:MAG: hypothetical protein M3326_07480 [Actinomycetota bacterium]|nr:hypothetical protein [Actinomycetota bacterium]
MFHYIFAKDEISYIAIAQRYADGNVSTAVNAYWAPLLSWLIAIPIALGVSPFWSAKLVTVAIGLFTLISVRALASAFDVDRPLRRFLDVVLVPMLVFASLAFVTPDLLLVGLLALYFSVVFDRDYARRRWAGVACGVLGALSFFCKQYAFFFFLGHLVVMTGVHCALGPDATTRRRVLRHGLSALAVFSALVLAWVGMLHHKYDRLMLGVNGTYNYAIVGPDSPGRPIFYFGFVAPPDARATSVWEEPYYFSSRVRSWSPVDSLPALKHQLKLVVQNLERTVDVFQTFSVFTAAILTGGLLLCIAGLGVLRERLAIVAALLTIALYPLGYLPVHSEERYLWPMFPLLVLMGSVLVSVLFGSHFFASQLRRRALIALFGLSLLVHPLAELCRRANDGRDVAAIAEQLEGSGLEHAKLASNAPDYNASVVVAYHLNAKYYGMARQGATEEQVVDELQYHHIEYYLAWEGQPMTSAALERAREVRGKTRVLTIYKVRPSH